MSRLPHPGTRGRALLSSGLSGTEGLSPTFPTFHPTFPAFWALLLLLLSCALSAGALAESEQLLCAHAGGVIDEHTYTNSLEAMENSYKWGYRVIEVDVRLTLDGEVVCEHDWEWFGRITGTPPVERKYKDFMRLKKYGTLTPMDLDMLITFMIQHIDCTIYLDTKYDNAEQYKTLFKKLVSRVEAVGDLAILDRFWIAIYSKRMYKTVNKIYPFAHYVFVSSHVWDGTVESMDDLCAYCVSEGIEAVDMWYYRVTDDALSVIRSHGLKAYAYTVDNEKTCQKLFRMGVDCVTTNYLLPERDPEQLKNIMKKLED